MKKFFFTSFLLTALTLGSHAQEKKLSTFNLSESVPLQSIQKNYHKSLMVLDTLDQYFLRSTGYLLQTALYGGYAMGTGYFYYIPTGTIQPATTETGMHFDGIGNATITELLIWFGAVNINGAPDVVTAKVYAAGVDSMPVNPVLGSSSLTTDLITASFTPTFTSFSFGAGIPVTSSFFVSLAYPNDDTLGIFGNNSINHDGLGEQRLRQKATGFLGGNWLRPTQLWNNLDADAFILPVVDIPSGTGELFTNDLFSLKPVYPTMADQNIFINYNLNKRSEVFYKIFDLSGRNIMESVKTNEQKGAHLQTINISSFSSGKYYISVCFDGYPVTMCFLKSKY